RWQAGPPRDHVGAAHRAEFPRYGVSLIGPRVGLRHAFRVGETRCWHEHEQIRRSTRDMLTRAAVALRSQDRLTLRDISHRAAIAPAFEPHDTPPASPTHMWLLMMLHTKSRITQKKLRGQRMPCKDYFWEFGSGTALASAGAVQAGHRAGIPAGDSVIDGSSAVRSCRHCRCGRGRPDARPRACARGQEGDHS